MAVFRVEKNDNYTVMSNFHLRDEQLSLKAKGLLSLMLSLPEEWDYTLAGLAKINKEGVDAIRSAVTELEQAGYVRRETARKDTGAFSGNRYVIYESPAQDSPLLGNPTTDSPLLENPVSGTPLPENPMQISKDRSSKESTPCNPPEEKAAETEAELFTRFWFAYPRKTDKQRAARAFRRLKVTGAMLGRMLAAMERQKRSRQWREANGQYIPHPSTWLNGRRWEDEAPPTSTGLRPDRPGGYPRMVESEEVPDW